METENKTKITVETTVQAPIEKVWDLWTKSEHIVHWNNASEDWYTPTNENDLRVGGKFLSRMEARDGSFGFNFEGTYDEVKDHELIAYSLTDGRKVAITFTSNGNETQVSENFEADSEHPADMQQSGWQAILDNFKKYVESN